MSQPRSKHLPLGDDRLWSKTEVARFLGVSYRTVERMVIPRLRIPGAGSRPLVRYDPLQVRLWAGAYRAPSKLPR